MLSETLLAVALTLADGKPPPCPTACYEPCHAQAMARLDFERPGNPLETSRQYAECLITCGTDHDLHVPLKVDDACRR